MIRDLGARGPIVLSSSHRRVLLSHCWHTCTTQRRVLLSHGRHTCTVLGIDVLEKLAVLGIVVFDELLNSAVLGADLFDKLASVADLLDKCGSSA